MPHTLQLVVRAALVSCCAALLLLAWACGDDGDNGGGVDHGVDIGPDAGRDAGCDTAVAGCPSVAGDWTVTKHCDGTYLGKAVTIQQTACSFTFAAPFAGWTGKIAKSGSITCSGVASSHNLSCTGSLSGKVISLNCTYGTYSCPMDMTRK